jgi:predicted Fe-Mo cluster-binding NifX family protein
LGLDEYEALRLCDALGLDQAMAAQSMGVSRPTLGRILERGRRKVAGALVAGEALLIQGGPVELGGRQGCQHHGRGKAHCGVGNSGQAVIDRLDGDDMEQPTPHTTATLLIAVPSVAPGGLDAAVAPHFGRCTCFTLARIENGQPLLAGVVDKAPESGCHASVSLLKAHGVQALLSQHIGLQPFNACCENGIAVLTTPAGTVAAALEAYAQHHAQPLATEDVCTAHSGRNKDGMSHEHHGHGQGQGNCGRR